MNDSPPPAMAPVLSRLSIGLALAGTLLLLLNVVLVGFDVLLRWVFNSPQSWVSDIGAVTYPVALACCFPAALEGGHMIAMRFLGERLGPRAARALDILGQASLAAVLGVFTWKMVERAAADWQAGYTTADIALPLAPSWLVVAVLLGISTALQLRVTWQLTRGNTSHA